MKHRENKVPQATKGRGSRKNPNNEKRKMTIAQYHRDLAEEYRKVKMPDHYEELAEKHIAEAERLEGLVYQVLNGEREQ